MPIADTVAVIFDFDDTLGEDTTELLLREKLDMDVDEIEEFWKSEVGTRVERGWDPPLAYIDLILKRLANDNLRLKNRDLRALGKKVALFPGVEDVFQRLRKWANTRKEFQKAHVKLEFYIITGGFQE